MQTRAHYERAVRHVTMVAVAVPLLCIAVPPASATSQGPLSPGTLASDNSYGTVAWTSPGFATASDNAYASTTNTPTATYYLKATNFGFSIPSGATINGIIADTEVKNGAGVECVDNRVRIVKGGTIGTTDKSLGGTWGTTDVTRSHGTSTDLWGETWTTTDINASNFGFVIAATFSSASCTPFVDLMSVTVHYTSGSVPELSTWAMLILFAVAAFAMHREGLIVPGFIRSGIYGEER